MDNVFNLSMIKCACLEIFDTQAIDIGEWDADFLDIDLLDTQIDLLSKKIKLLPDDYQQVLLSRMCFNLSATETSEIFGIENPKKTFNYSMIILGYSLSLKEGERIAFYSLKKACDRVLSSFVTNINEKHLQQSIPNYKRKKRLPKIKNKLTFANRILNRAAILLIGLLLCGLTVITVNASIREKIFDWVVTTYEKYTSFSIVSENDVGIDSAIDLDQISLAYIPAGFELTEEYAGDRRIVLQYHNQSGTQVFLVCTKPDGTTHDLNTEDAIIEDILINEYKAIYWTKNDTIFIVWEQQDYLFSLITELNKENAIKIAENIQISRNLE